MLSSILSIPFPGYYSCVIVHTFHSLSRLLQLCYRPYFPFPFQAITAVLSSKLSLHLPGYYSCGIVHTFPYTSRLLQLCYHPYFPFSFQAITAVLSSICTFPSSSRLLHCYCTKSNFEYCSFRKLVLLPVLVQLSYAHCCCSGFYIRLKTSEEVNTTDNMIGTLLLPGFYEPKHQFNNREHDTRL